VLPTHDVSSHKIPSANPRKTIPILLVAEKDVWGGLWFNPLNAELNPIYPLLALFGAHHILHVSS